MTVNPEVVHRVRATDPTIKLSARAAADQFGLTRAQVEDIRNGITHTNIITPGWAPPLSIYPVPNCTHPNLRMIPQIKGSSLNWTICSNGCVFGARRKIMKHGFSAGYPVHGGAGAGSRFGFKSSMMAVHNLMAIAFADRIKNPNKLNVLDPAVTVDHLDNDPKNNRLENLEIVTHAENATRGMVSYKKYRDRKSVV